MDSPGATVRRRGLVAVLLLSLAALGADCETDAAGCRPTTLTHLTDGKVEVVVGAGGAGVSEPGILEARLTTDDTGEGLAGKTVSFFLLEDGQTLVSMDAVTSGEGTATVELKTTDLDALTGWARANAYATRFSGDTEFCSTSEETPIEVAIVDVAGNVVNTGDTGLRPVS
jgi:hypothetical protein